MKSTADKIIEFLEDQKLIFYKRDLDDDSNVIILLPYRIHSETIRQTFKIFTNNQTNTYKMGFSCKLNPEKDSSKELLNFNAEIINGSLSVPTNSEEVTFFALYTLEESESFTKKQYKASLLYCISILLKLKEKDIIITEECDTDDRK